MLCAYQLCLCKASHLANLATPDLPLRKTCIFFYPYMLISVYNVRMIIYGLLGGGMACGLWLVDRRVFPPLLPARRLEMPKVSLCVAGAPAAFAVSATLPAVAL